MIWPFGRRHQHTYRTEGYGGAGWWLIVCTECGHRELESA